MNWDELSDLAIEDLVYGFKNKCELIDFCKKYDFIYRKNQSFKRLKEDLIRDIKQVGIFKRIVKK